MAFFDQALEAKVMSSTLLIRANISKKILLEAYQIAIDFEQRYSAYNKDSYLNKINTLGSKEKIECTQEDMELFSTCREASELSDGAFDISMGALTHGAYHFGFKNQEIASSDTLKRQKKLVDYNSIVLGSDSIFLKKDGMRLDLGAIGKGYVAKLIAKFLQTKGASRVLVDVGGEIVCFGKSFTLGIKDPFKDENIAYIKTSKEAVSISTSGNYERFIDTPENHHIIDKESAVSSNYYSSMTLIQNGFEIDMLDAFATAMFNKDRSYVKGFSKDNNLASIVIDKDTNITFNNTRDLKLVSIELAYK